LLLLMLARITVAGLFDVIGGFSFYAFVYQVWGKLWGIVRGLTFFYVIVNGHGFSESGSSPEKN